MVNIKESCKHRQFEALGTFNEIRIYDCFDDTLLEKAVNRVLEIDDRMSAFKKYSDISNLNRNAGIKPVKVHSETLNLLILSKKISELSGGAFDITVRPVVELWGIGRKYNFIPTKREINKVKKYVNYKDLIIDEKNSSAYLKKVGEAVDLGGIAKGYAADEVKRILVQEEATSAIINLGGNIVTIGERPDSMQWCIGIQNPTAVTGNYFGLLYVSDKTVVTSGVNERFFIKDGIRYHHIIDPRCGKPAKSSLLSVTAVCESSVIADALTTAAFVLGIQRGSKLLQEFDAEAVFVTDELNVIATNGLKSNLTILN